MLYYQMLENHVQFFRNSNKYLRRTIFPNRNLAGIPNRSFTICTTCMNRLHDLSKTLPKNLEDNADYEDVEFLVLDYSSNDGLKKWIQGSAEIKQYLDSGRLVVYRVDGQTYFRPNHSRNMSFRLATGEMVANVDSDNFTHKGYVSRLNECASVSDSNLLIVPDNFLVRGNNRIFLKGRFALYKKDIELLQGFDEELDDGFGHDDLNFVFRAMLAGFKIVRYESKYTEGRLETKDAERVLYVKNKDYRKMQDVNASITHNKLSRGKIAVNPNGWGKGIVWKNYEQKIEL